MMKHKIIRALEVTGIQILSGLLVRAETSCGPGFETNGASCTPCPDGFFKNSTSIILRCSRCPSKSSCTKTQFACLPGYQVNWNGDITCDPCPQQFQKLTDDNNETCSKCPSNTFKYEIGSGVCSPCPEYGECTATGFKCASGYQITGNGNCSPESWFITNIGLAIAIFLAGFVSLVIAGLLIWLKCRVRPSGGFSAKPISEPASNRYSTLSKYFAISKNVLYGRYSANMQEKPSETAGNRSCASQRSALNSTVEPSLQSATSQSQMDFDLKKLTFAANEDDEKVIENFIYSSQEQAATKPSAPSGSAKVFTSASRLNGPVLDQSKTSILGPSPRIPFSPALSNSASRMNGMPISSGDRSVVNSNLRSNNFTPAFNASPSPPKVYSSHTISPNTSPAGSETLSFQATSQVATVLNIPRPSKPKVFTSANAIIGKSPPGVGQMPQTSTTPTLSVESTTDAIPEQDVAPESVKLENLENTSSSIRTLENEKQTDEIPIVPARQKKTVAVSLGNLHPDAIRVFPVLPNQGKNDAPIILKKVAIERPVTPVLVSPTGERADTNQITQGSNKSLDRSPGLAKAVDRI